MISHLFAGLAAMSFATWAVLIVSAWRVSREGIPRSAPAAPMPVSILKPIKGAEPGLEERLESLYAQRHPEYEVIFSIASREDAAAPIAARVAGRHPDVPTTFVFDLRERGANPKVSRLAAALPMARFRHLLIADADISVAPDFLARSMADFRDPRVGLVSNVFVGAGGATAAERLEGLHFDTFTLGGTAAVSRLLGRPCVVGKSMFLSREALDGIGGLDRVKDFLAEDYLLGESIRAGGYRVVLSGHRVIAHSGGRSLRAAWSRQVRWARMRRKLAGAGYAIEAIVDPTVWLLSAAVACPGILRIVLAGLTAVKVAAELMLARELAFPVRAGDVPLTLARGVASFGIFWAGLVSSRTSWRGKSVRLGPRTLVLDPNSL